MAKIAMNKAWAENSTNKVVMSDDDFSRGIIFESAVESKIPNQAVYMTSRAVKEQQEFGGTLYIEGKTYPQGSIVLVMINLGTYIGQRMYLKIGAETNSSFPMVEKTIYQSLGETIIYNLTATNTREWQEITGYSSSDLIADYQNDRSYDIGERCYVWYDVITYEIFLSKPAGIATNPYRYRKKLISSSKENNTDIPSAETLLTTWFIEDGFETGQGKIDLAKRDIYQAGYLLVNAENFDTKYEFDKYPRVKMQFEGRDLVIAENFSCFIKYSDYEFKIRDDLRGMFMRLHSNGSETIDKDRLFHSSQSPALPNVKGGVINIDRTGEQIPSFKNPTGAFSRTQVANNGHALISGNGVSITYTKGLQIDNNAYNPIYKDDHNDVTPYNFNVNLLVKV